MDCIFILPTANKLLCVCLFRMITSLKQGNLKGHLIKYFAID